MLFEDASGLDKEVAGRISGPTQTSSSDAESCLVESEVITIEKVSKNQVASLYLQILMTPVLCKQLP